MKVACNEHDVLDCGNRAPRTSENAQAVKAETLSDASHVSAGEGTTWTLGFHGSLATDDELGPVFGCPEAWLSSLVAARTAFIEPDCLLFSSSVT